MSKEKIDINIVFNGLSGSGKSTTAGHLLYKLEGSDKSLIELIEKRIEKEDSDMSLKYALLLDHLRGQPERGMTSGIPHLKFETTKYCCTFTDEPVRIDFINADCAVLIIDSTTAGRPPTYYELIDELMIDSSELINDSNVGRFKPDIDDLTGRFKPDIDDLTCGVRPKQMICCFNKMDATTPKYSKHRYHEVCEVVASYLEDVGIMRQINPIKITFVPISGFEGDNLIERSTNLDWYKGPTLLEALDQINEPTSDYMNLSPMPEENLIYDEEPSPKLGGWSSESPKESTGLGKLYWDSPDLKLKESPMPSEENLDDGKSTGLGKLYWDSPDLKLKESPMPSEEEAPAEGEESPEYSKKLAEEMMGS